MNSVFVILIVILAVVMIAIVLIQKSKGGGLAAGFQSSNQIMGAPKTADFLEKATWSIMAAIAVLCIACTINTHKGTGEQNAVIQATEVESTMSTPENTAEAPVETEAPAEAE